MLLATIAPCHNLKWLASLVFMLCLLIDCTQAGVIKKRDTAITATETGGNIVTDRTLTAEVQPTILSALRNASEVVSTTKLQSVVGTQFATESSKELTNNEILINEAKKLLEEDDKLINSNNETELKQQHEKDRDSKEDHNDLSKNQTHTVTKAEDDLQDIKQIILQLENKEQGLADAGKTTTEFSTNVIQADKLAKHMDQSKETENSSSLENRLKIQDEKPRPPSRILTELRTESPTRKPKVQVSQLENSLENSKEHDKNEITLESNEKPTILNNETTNAINIKPVEIVTTTLKPFIGFPANSEEDALKSNSLESSKAQEQSLTSKSLHTQEEALNSNTLETTTTATVKIDQQTSTSVLKVTGNPEVLEMTTIMPENSNKIHDGLDRQELLKINDIKHMITTTAESLVETTMQPLSKDEDVLIFEGDKTQHARSMFMEDTTTVNPQEVNELLMPVTTFRPVILSIKQGIEETTPTTLKEQVEEVFKESEMGSVTAFSGKEKKPKFINDNSTNAQQLNLPNNAEVWSLAAMKSLPKANVTMETAQTHAETHKDNILQNNTLTVNSNSEKNLLDWSQIMMDKELSTTTRNEEYKQPQEQEVEKEKQVNQVWHEDSKTQHMVIETLQSSTTTLLPELAHSVNKLEGREEDAVTINSLMEAQLSTSTISGTTTEATILSHANDNNSHDNDNRQPDKKVEENMNNHLETLDVATTTTATAGDVAAAKIVDNHPFNTSLNIEPNLNEINLTSNQTQADLNNDVHETTTTAGKQSVQSVDDDGANVNVNAEVATTTTTEATAAVADMTTVEQISSETTTVSTPETGKQNASLSTDAVSPQQQNNNNNNNVVNFEESNNELENTVQESGAAKQTNQYYDNIELNTKSTTTTVVPITTFRPTILAITSTTSTPPPPAAAVTFEQEVDQNGNEIQTNLNNAEQQLKQKQSITTETETKTETETNLHDNNNSTKTIETHLSEREFETTTHETITTTATAELAASETDNTLKSSLEYSTTTTTTTTTASTIPPTTTTSSSKDELIDETTEIILEIKETTTTTTSTQTTPKQVDETTIGSAVTTDKLERKELETETTTPAETTGSTTSTTEASKTPVVVIDTQTVAVNESFTPSTTEQNTISTTTATAIGAVEQEESVTKEEIAYTKDANIETTTSMSTTMSTTTTTAAAMPVTAATKDDETYISLLDDTTTTAATINTQSYSPTISTTSQTLTTTTLPSSSSSTLPSAITTKVEEIYNVIHSTTTELIQTTTQQLLTETEEDSSSPPPSSTTSTYFTEMLPSAPTTASTHVIGTADIGKSLPTLTSIMGGNSGNMYPKNPEASGETDVNVIIAITVSVIGVIALILLVGFLYLMRKRQKQNSYPNRCRPVSMDEFTIDNASVGGSMRKSSALRSSKRTYGNLAFDDPSLRHNAMGVHELARFVQEKLRIFEEFRDVPQITSRLDEVPPGCEDKNRYANVLPLPETRVILQRLNDDDKTEYINANYVTGPKDAPNYYIACQAPLDSTVEDFWRMIWEQQSRVIIQATDLIENGVEKCAEYLPPSVTLDNHSSFGDFQITLQNREVKDKYAISTILLKNVSENASRELTHYWYKWPEVGVPSEEAPIIAMLLEARSSLISYAIEQANEDKEKSSMATLKSAEEGTVSNNGSSTMSPTNNSNGSSANGSTGEINGNISMVHIKKTVRNQGPLTIHCSPGTGRTGTIIACDIAIRSLETPKRTVDIPQIVYYVRRGRASAVLTKEQYEFIYKVANMYAAKITNPTNYN